MEVVLGGVTVAVMLKSGPLALLWGSYGVEYGVELWGGVMGWSYGAEYGVELWGGVMGWSYGAKVLITLKVKLTVMAYLWYGNSGALHNHSTALTANFSLPAELMAVLQDLALCEALSEVSQTTLSF